MLYTPVELPWARVNSDYKFPPSPNAKYYRYLNRTTTFAGLFSSDVRRTVVKQPGCTAKARRLSHLVAGKADKAASFKGSLYRRTRKNGGCALRSMQTLNWDTATE